MTKPSNKSRSSSPIKDGGMTSSSSSNTTSGVVSGTNKKPLDLKDVPLTFPEFATVDPSQIIPRYSAVLKRTEQEGVGLEDVDVLQMELEALLSSTVVRKITLKQELSHLNQLDKFKARNGSHGGKKGPSSPGKRSNDSWNSNCGSSKKIKLGKPSDSTLSSFLPSKVIIGIPKISKSEQKPLPSFDPLQNEQIRPLSSSSLSVDHLGNNGASSNLLPKNETPSRFWSFVEPYCAPITASEIKLLDDLIQTHNDLSEYFHIPAKGKHYSKRWALEDEVKAAEIKDGTSLSLGDFTQRLVAGLMEEEEEEQQQIPGSVSIMTEDDSKCLTMISNPEILEAQVCKELEEQGILEPSEDLTNVHQRDDDDDDEEGVDEGDTHDEILEELKKCQAELKAVSSQNLQHLKRLLQSAKEEMVRQELRNKLQEADKRVMESYKRISLARSQKKDPTKRDRDQAWKSLKEREIILKQLESI